MSDQREEDPEITPNRPDETSLSAKLLSEWKKGQHILEAFWRSWRTDYLQSLREPRHLMQTSAHALAKPAVGDIVLVKEDAPCGTWKMGCIHRLTASRDGCIRAADVKLPSGHVLLQPINHIPD